MPNLDSSADFVSGERRNRLPQEESLQSRGVHDSDVMDNAHAQLHGPQAAAVDAEVHLPLARVEHEVLQGWTPGEDEVEVLVIHGHAAEAELLEAGEGNATGELRGVGEPPDAEVEALDERQAEDGDRERDVERQGPIHEDELLDALDGEEVEPAHELGVVRDHGGAGEVDAAEGARVRLQGLRHRRRDRAGVGVTS